MGEPDESGRRRPVVTDRTALLACDHVLLALGQSADTGAPARRLDARATAACTRRRQPDQRLRRRRPRHRRRHGDARHRQRPARGGPRARRPRRGGRGLRAARPRAGAVPLTDIRLDHFAPPTRGARSASSRRRRASRTFDEVNHGLADAARSRTAASPAATARTATPASSTARRASSAARRRTGYEVDYTYCKGCGICVDGVPAQRHGDDRHMTHRAAQRQPRRGRRPPPWPARANRNGARLRRRRLPDHAADRVHRAPVQAGVREGPASSASRASTARWRVCIGVVARRRAHLHRVVVQRPGLHDRERLRRRASTGCPIVMMAVNRTLGPAVEHLGRPRRHADAARRGLDPALLRGQPGGVRHDPARLPPGRGRARAAAGAWCARTPSCSRTR